MSLSQEQGRKWITAFLAMCSVVLVIVTMAFINQMGDWFELEAKIPYFNGVSQGFGVLCGFICFFGFYRHRSSMQYLDEVFAELTKVVWPTKDETVKLTIGIVIGVFASAVFLAFVDLVFGKLFGLLY